MYDFYVVFLLCVCVLLCWNVIVSILLSCCFYVLLLIVLCVLFGVSWLCVSCVLSVVMNDVVFLLVRRFMCGIFVKLSGVDMIGNLVVRYL